MISDFENLVHNQRVQNVVCFVDGVEIMKHLLHNIPFQRVPNFRKDVQEGGSGETSS